MTRDLITIEVAFGTAEHQEVLRLTVPRGTTLLEAVNQSGVRSCFPRVDLDDLPKGVFGAHRDDAYLVQAGDRIEIYRHLQKDPKEARRIRAELHTKQHT